MRLVKAAFSLIATAALVACGGGGESTETAASQSTNPADSTAPLPVIAPFVPTTGTAAVCFNPALQAAGSAFKTVTLATYSGQGTAQLVSDTKIGGLSSFNGNSAMKMSGTEIVTPDAALVALGQAASTASVSRYFLADSAAGSIKVYGAELARAAVNPSERQDITITNSPYIESRFNLTPGQSFDQNYIQNQKVTRASGTTDSPSTSYKKNVLFVGVAAVTVPAGTFQACQFVETGTVSYSGSPGEASTGIATIWTGVGSGLPIKTVVKQDAAGTGITSTFELLSATINGATLAP